MLSDLYLYKSNFFLIIIIYLTIQIVLIIDYGEEFPKLILPSKS